MTTPPDPAVPSPPVTATVEPPTPDARPVPPPMPTLYLCRWQEWDSNYNNTKWEWRWRTSMFPNVVLETIEAEAVGLRTRGCVNISVVTIPAPGASA